MSFSRLWVPAAPAQLVLYPTSWAGLLAAGAGWGLIPWESLGLMATVGPFQLSYPILLEVVHKVSPLPWGKLHFVTTLDADRALVGLQSRG